jgi:hypothetical protein
MLWPKTFLTLLKMKQNALYYIKNFEILNDRIFRYSRILRRIYTFHIQCIIKVEDLKLYILKISLVTYIFWLNSLKSATKAINLASFKEIQWQIILVWNVGLHSQKWWVLCSFAYLRWRRRDVCNFHMIYVDDIIHNCMCVIFWTWKWYIESSWIKWNKN